MSKKQNRIQKLIFSIKKRRFKKLVRKQKTIELYGYIMTVISVRGDVCTVEIMRDTRVEHIKLSKIIVPHKGKNVRLSNIGLFSY